MTRVISVLFLVFSFSFARAESPRADSEETKREVELVRQYINSHGSKNFKLVYSGTNALATIIWGLAASKSLFVQTRIFGRILLGLGGWNLYDNYFYWRYGHHYFPFKTGSDPEAVELPLPDVKGEVIRTNSFSPLEIETVKNYIDLHRSYFLRVFNIAVDTVPLLLARRLLPSPIGELAVLTGTAINVDSLLFWYTRGRVSIIQPYIDQLLGYPKFVVEEYRRIGQTLQDMSRAPRPQAQAMAMENSRIRMIVHFAAHFIAPQSSRSHGG